MNVIADVWWKKIEYKIEESNKESPLPHGTQHKKSILVQKAPNPTNTSIKGLSSSILSWKLQHITDNAHPIRQIDKLLE